jgi:hypothetical protein
MPTYYCDCCEFATHLKGNYKQHLGTKKHMMNYNLTIKEKELEMNTNEHKMNTNEHKMNTNEPMDLSIKDKKFVCEYCNEKFNTKPSMRRHQNYYCKEIPQESLYEKLQRSEKEKKKLYKKIEKLMEKPPSNVSQRINSDNINQNINNTQNNQNSHNKITLNCYGCEDLSHITGSVLDKLINGPGTMISKLTELIHFNDKKPENMNMYVPNKRAKFIKTYIEDKWKLENKKVKINDILKRNCGIIDDHYIQNKDKYSNFSKKNYSLVNDGIENDDKKILKDQFDSVEIGLLNGTDKFKELFDNFSEKVTENAC